MRKIYLCRTAAIAGLVVLGAFASAFFDPTIAISRAVTGNALTIHYKGAHARTIELLINGQSMATRTVNPNDSSGNAYFSIDPLAMQDGQNTVEIKIYSVKGRLLGIKKSTIDAGTVAEAPFFMKAPSMGQTVQGSVRISVGMSQSFTSPYVSFFIDNKLRSFSNTPPFTFDWDTTSEPNGWHTLQSWLVSNSETYKTQSLKVFVNNPGGMTPRESQSQVEPAKTNPVKSTVKPMPVKTAPKASQTQPKVSGLVGMNQIHSHLYGSAQSTKPIVVAGPSMAGPRQLIPKYVTANSLKKNAVALAEPEARFVSITNGTRLMSSNSAYMTGTFSILLNGAFVPFDVQPRIDQGIPMTPIRYLLQQDGGTVRWDNLTKTVTAKDEGKSLWVRIGDNIAKVNSAEMTLDKAPYIDGSRAIVPLSFIRDALKVDVQYDKTTNHVLITSRK